MSPLARIFLFFACLIAVIVATENPEKRPALLSRYGRAVLSRYGKRSGNMEIQGGPFGDNELLLCRNLGGQVYCAPYALGGQ